MDLNLRGGTRKFQLQTTWSQPGFVTLHMCVAARSSRGDVMSARHETVALDLDDAWNLEEHVLMADLASGRQDSAHRLIMSEVAIRRCTSGPTGHGVASYGRPY